MYEISTATAIGVWAIAAVFIIVLSFKIKDYRQSKESVDTFFLVIDVDSKYRILACCEYFEDALKLARELYNDKGTNTDVIPVDMNTIYE